MSRNLLGLSILLFVLGVLAEAIGYVFMIMHWPGAIIMRIAGVIFFIPGFLLLIVYITNRKRKTGTRMMKGGRNKKTLTIFFARVSSNFLFLTSTSIRLR
jgi:formate/nitrite transporter FocA (FNT family)